jgi:hypothetical protein
MNLLHVVGTKGREEYKGSIISRFNGGAAPFTISLMLKRIMWAVAVWYFVLFSSTGGVATQIGPFATQTACSDYRTQFASNGGAAPCFSTTAKQ